MTRVVELIQRKRDGGSLDPEEIRDLIERYTAREVPEYQMASLLMAILFRGLDATELGAWSRAMLESGDQLDLATIDRPKVDKHSTGGVGDKVSIPLAPMVAACGVAVPMMSGRGLGHTGGTLDKLESIPGFRTSLDPPEFLSILERFGLVLAGQSDTLVPADRALYALRDATGTVPSIPLIASSIMSKKLAEDLDALVLDVKVGSGAFMKDRASARDLARTMVGLGAEHGVEVDAFLTAMDQPLGMEVGNANEITESVAILTGEGPDDLTEVVHTLGARMLVLAGVSPDDGDARDRLDAVVNDGRALELFRRVVAAQSGNPDALDDPSLLPIAPHHQAVRANAPGYVIRCDALAIGVAAMRAGAGRAAKDDAIDHGVGVSLHAKVGHEVDQGAALATLHYTDERRAGPALEMLESAFDVGTARPEVPPVVLEEIT